MSSYKERWFADMERRLAENEDRGMDFDTAYTKAAAEAYDNLIQDPLEAAYEDLQAEMDAQGPPSEEDEAANEEAEWYAELNRGYEKDRI